MTASPSTDLRPVYTKIRTRPRLSLDGSLLAVLRLLIANKPLPPKYRDHPLTGDWSDHRDCHLKPDLILIYRLPDLDTVQLVRLGSHSELGF